MNELPIACGATAGLYFVTNAESDGGDGLGGICNAFSGDGT
jgi:hypothetical protein